MATRRALSRVTETSLAEICSAPLGVLVLARTTNGRCDVYQADIERLMARGEFGSIPIGKLVVDEPDSHRYLDASTLNIDDRSYPVTILYEFGEEVDRFSTSRASYLLRRIAVVDGSRSN